MLTMLMRLRTLLAGRFGNQQGRMPGLDALRGIAALTVVFYHYTLRYQEVVGPYQDSLWFTFSYAAIGVQLFFAISGFVIFMTMERCVSGRDFAVSRFARLYPPFLFCMLLTALVAWVSGFNLRHVQVDDVLLNLVMVVGWFGRNYVDGSYWTLTCEISFYVLIALFFYQVQRRLMPAGRDNFDLLMRNPLLPALLLWMIAVAIGRSSNADLFTRWPLVWNFLYGHLFVTGIAVYGFTKGKLILPAMLLAIAALCGGVTATGQFSPASCLKVLGIAALIWAGAHFRLSGYAAKVAGFLGGISYSLYLIHQAVGYGLINAMVAAHINANFAILVTCALMIALAALIRRYVEIPSQTLIIKAYAPWKSRKIALPVSGPA